MRYAALATDYDGTIARDGVVEEKTIVALGLLRQAGWRLILATGRELEDVRTLMPGLAIFDRVVAENGAVLYDPATGHVRLLAAPPPPLLAIRLAAKGVDPLHQGLVVVETWQEHEVQVRATIQELGLTLTVLGNKGALMILPAGISKATGTAEAMHELGVIPADCVGVGDAENDVDLLALCGLSVAAAGALPIVKQAADLVLQADGGDGMAQLVHYLLKSALTLAEP